MAKGGKTRKQKKLADLRRRASLSTPTIANITIEKKPSEFIINTPTINPATQIPPTQKASIMTIDYKYITGDLLKTLFLTFVIVLTEIFIRFTIK